ncbi:formate-nitrite transporter, partial [Enterococcus faecalis]
MLAVSTAWVAKKVSLRVLLVNWVTITLAIMVGALFVAYFYGHYLGLTSSGAQIKQGLFLSDQKNSATRDQPIINRFGC